MVEGLESLLAVFHIWIGNHGVFTVNEQGMNPVAALVEGAHLGYSLFCCDFRLISLAELLSKFGEVTGLETRKVVRDGAAVPCALNVVLPPHGIDASPLETEVPCHEREVAKRLYIVDPADVLCNA